MSDEAPVGTEKIEGIVVGADRSQQSKCALRWAEREAVRRGSVLNIRIRLHNSSFCCLVPVDARLFNFG